MLSVELIDQLLPIPEILRRFPASLNVTAILPLYEIMERPVASLSVEDPVNFAFIRVVDHRRLRLRWRLAGGRSCIPVVQRDVENDVLPDRIRKV
jgi:hypothetical protein